MATVYLYALKDPRDGLPYYIGQSEKPATRLKSHLAEARAGGSTRKSSWVRTLLKAGVKPLLEVISEVPAECAYAVERWLINGLRGVYPLVNDESADDGAGVFNSFRPQEPLKSRLNAIVASAPVTKNDVLQVVISLGLDALEANPKLLLERHVELLQQKKAQAGGEA
jgi:hypothetical protein